MFGDLCRKGNRTLKRDFRTAVEPHYPYLFKQFEDKMEVSSSSASSSSEDSESEE